MINLTTVALIEVMWEEPTIEQKDIDERLEKMKAVLEEELVILQNKLRVHVWSSFVVKLIEDNDES